MPSAIIASRMGFKPLPTTASPAASEITPNAHTATRAATAACARDAPGRSGTLRLATTAAIATTADAT